MEGGLFNSDFRFHEASAQAPDQEQVALTDDKYIG